MHAIEICIHNFRSILDASFQMQPYTVLVGENNTGKSNVIDAIRAFYDDYKFDDATDLPRIKADDTESWIEIEFKPSVEELKNLKDEYRMPRSTFRVRKYLKSSTKDTEGKPKSGIYAYVDGGPSDSRFYGFKNVGQAKLGEILYVPAVSRIDDHTKLSGPSVLRNLVQKVLKRVMDSSAAYGDLKTSLVNFEEKIKLETTDDGFSLNSIEQHVSQEISAWGTKFRLVVNPIGTEEFVKTLLGHEIYDDFLGQAQTSGAYGHGFQRSLIYALIRVAARYETPKKSADGKEFSPDLTWVLFEEPEAFLHPAQIDTLNADLLKFSDESTSQVLLTTHNPQLTSKNIENLSGLVRLSRGNQGTEVGQITPATLQSILSQNQSIAAAWQASGVEVDQDDLNVDMETLKYILWLDSRRCGAFFAESVLLVEGPTEVALINYLLENGQLIRPKGSLFVLDALGKWNMPRFMSLLRELRIYHSVLYDADSGKKPIIDQSIHSAKNTFTRAIDSFPSDLEDFLGVPSTRPHRKPQHVMHHVIQKRVPPAVLSQISQKVQPLIT